MGPEQFAEQWVAQNKDDIAPLMEPGFDLRTVVLEHLAVDAETGVAKAGLPGLYIAARAPYDRDCYDLVYALAAGQGQQPEAIGVLCAQITDGTLPRPSAGRGRPYSSGGRDFVLTLLIAALQENSPELPFGANDATFATKSAAAIALRALEAGGFEVIDGNKPADALEVPAQRSVERAVRRSQNEQKIPELFF
ncbi:hypothetical protein [Roseovarius sp.]|uniref:hypothetical protein n=1 Tax=Roseovarius sp. TaxID=1486281 RepID=UPI00260CE65A|nr:hypothetical protein [Roseovarius sp.]